MSTEHPELPEYPEGSGPVASEQDRRVERMRWRVTHVFFATACAVAGCMFVFKLHEFLRTIKRDELAGFAFDPILTYAFVAMGFFCLLVWAFLSGQFRDIEKPKHDMLERFAQQERDEGLHFEDPR